MSDVTLNSPVGLSPMHSISARSGDVPVRLRAFVSRTARSAISRRRASRESSALNDSLRRSISSHALSGIAFTLVPPPILLTVSALRGFGQSSIIFVLAVTERIAQVGGGTQSTASYAVTLTRGAGSWQVTDIEPAQDGNL